MIRISILPVEETKVQIESLRGPKGEKGDACMDEQLLLDALDRWGMIHLMRDDDGAALCGADGAVLVW